MSWLTSFISWITGLFSGSKSQSTQVMQIQAAAVKLCAFLPTAESVLAVAASGNATVVTVSVVAHQICEIVTQHPPIPQTTALELVGDAPTVQTWQSDGVTIQGTFVR